MPILEYVCKECARHFETIVQGTQIPVCPSCMSTQLEKQFSVFAVVGGKGTEVAAQEAVGPCGACGDPRGPGACAMD